MVSFRSSFSRGISALWVRARIRAITSPARFPSRTMRRTASRASSRLGASPASQRRQALPLLTTPASGWLTSCAIEAASSPMMLTRLMCARSASSWRSLSRSSSARLRSSMSVLVPYHLTIFPRFVAQRYVADQEPAILPVRPAQRALHSPSASQHATAARHSSTNLPTIVGVNCRLPAPTAVPPPKRAR